MCLFVVVNSSEGWEEALPPFESMMATVGRMVFPDFDVCMCEERAEFAQFVSVSVDLTKS